MKISKSLALVSIATPMIFAAFAWLSFSMLDAERAREENATRTQTLEQSRLALWRMDATFSAILNRHASTLPSDFSVPETRGNFELERFEISPPENHATAAEHPETFSRENALWEFATREQNVSEPEIFPADSDAEDVFEENPALTDFRFRRRATDSFFSHRKISENVPATPPLPERANAEQARLAAGFANEQAENSASETLAKTEIPTPGNVLATTEFVGELRAIWFADELFCVRAISDSDGKILRAQCVRLDSGKIFARLLADVRELLPNARLVRGRENGGETFALAGLPATLVPGTLPSVAGDGEKSAFSALEISLAVAWACLILAVAGVLGFVAIALRESERRATFASAVTHELRTPLTTFGLYSEMLASGLVPEAKRAEYYAILKRESERLSNLVENVLAFAKVERGRGAFSRRERMSVESVRDAILPRARKRLADAEMRAEIFVEPTAQNFFVKTNVSALEQVFFNLADNAAKYARVPGGAVKIRFGISGKFLAISFEDSGPGVPEEFREKLFEPFSRSAKTAAGKQPGVGLGLALCRQIARELGGDLRVEKSDASGTRFLLKVAR